MVVLCGKFASPKQNHYPDQICAGTRHQYGISALISQTTFHWKTSDSAANVGCFLRLPIFKNKVFIAITCFFVLICFFTLYLLDRSNIYRARLLSIVVVNIFINVYTIISIGTTSWLSIRCSWERKDRILFRDKVT